MTSNKLALVATILCFAGGIGAATAFAHGGSTPQQTTTTTCQNDEQGNDEQGDANDVAAAADDDEGRSAQHRERKHKAHANRVRRTGSALVQAG